MARRKAAFKKEFDDYLAFNAGLPTITDNSQLGFRFKNPLEWWISNRARFPNLAFLARQFLSIQATSAPSERVFSMGGRMVSKLRTCLLPENVEHLIFARDSRMAAAARAYK